MKRIKFILSEKGVKHALFALSCFVFLLCSANSFAQNNVRGTVKDSNGESLIGVNVIIKGTSQGASTDVNGEFNLSVPNKNATLEFTYVGYKSQEVALNGRTLLNIVLAEDNELLDEVVVVGYGIQKKEHMTGSVASVSSKELNKVPVSNTSQLLVGKAPGISGVQSTGGPDTDGTEIYVRGFGTYNGSSAPLVLVDGVERPMNHVNPRDIQSMSVLKDAAAAAVYGMRAANGVILITTKRGAEGRHNISYDGTFTWSKPTTLPDFVNGQEYMQWYNKALEMDGLPPHFTEEEVALVNNGDPTDGYENTDWLAPAMKATLMQKHNLSVTGGSDRIKYFASGEMMTQEGFLDTHRFTQYGFRSNIDTKPVENVTFALNIAGRLRNNYTNGIFTWGNQEDANVWGVLMYARPFVPREYKGYPTAPARRAVNPYYGVGNSGQTENKNYHFESSARLEWDIPWIDGLKANMFAAWDHDNLNGKSFNHSYEVMHYNLGSKTYNLANAVNLTQDGALYQNHTRNTSYTLRPAIEYTNTFGDHTVGALFLYEQNGLRTDNFYARRTGFNIFDIQELDRGKEIPAPGETYKGNGGTSGRIANAGYVGRLNYAYANKYLAEFSFRYDGTYLFAKDYRWGFFPSGSVAYVISEEDFMSDYKNTINQLKIRGSIGQLGRNTVKPYLFLKSYDIQNLNVAFGEAPLAQNTLVSTSSMPMPNLTWEKTRTYNLGLDALLWDGLLGFEFDAFYKFTYDILQGRGGTYPPSLGGNYPTIENSGEFDNRGFELVVTHRNKIGDVNYNLSANTSFSRNRILKMTERDNILPWQSAIGRPLGRVMGYKSDGLFQTQEELDHAPLPPGRTPQLGDIKYIDTDGDGRITYDDRVEIARTRHPELVFAMNGDLEWRGLDFSFMFQGAALYTQMLQHTWLNGVEDMTPLTRPFYGGGDTPPRYLVEGSWRPDNTDARYPRLTATGGGNNAFPSDFWFINGSYLRLKNITIGYTLPKVLLSKAGINNLRVYMAGLNLLTFSGFKYLDPEAPNALQGYYPQQKSISLGLELSF